MHPETETLQAYLRNIDAPEFDTVRLHLAGCADCRHEVDALSALDGFIPEPDTDSCSEQQHKLIRDFVDGPLQGDKRTEIEALLHDNPAAMKAALHYASHSTAMSSAIAAATAEETSAAATHNNSAHETTARPASLMSKLYHDVSRRLAMRPPLWAVVPATALAAAMLAVSMQTFFARPGDDFIVASYRDNPVMQFSNNQTLPGIGFFNKAARQTRSYNNVRVSIIDASHLKIDWPAVDNASLYTIRLQLFNHGQKVSLGDVSTETPGAVFETAALNAGHRYEWILSGKTRDDMAFYATGGFVINKTD
jgi:anti-sigma factor RsiW